MQTDIETDSEDFGPIYVSAEQIQSWLFRSRRANPPKRSAALDMESAALRSPAKAVAPVSGDAPESATLEIPGTVPQDRQTPKPAAAPARKQNRLVGAPFT